MTVSGPTSRWKEFPVFVYPGRAGHPRDFDPARRIDLHSGGETYAYAIADLDRNVVTLYRVAYPIETAQKKILDAGLPPMLAYRLGMGR